MFPTHTRKSYKAEAKIYYFLAWPHQSIKFILLANTEEIKNVFSPEKHLLDFNKQKFLRWDTRGSVVDRIYCSEPAPWNDGV